MLEIKKICHACPHTEMLYLYPAKLCPWCHGAGLDIRMTAKEVKIENIKRQFQAKLKEGL